ncbi:MAG TPA: hypothetical protein VHX38_02270 [Pseudonocardiaceae bacterium]|nr:hypothetical protein [Pseudonocardiaceae bacterium]
MSPATRAIHRRATRIEIGAALALVVLFAVLAAVSGVDWPRLASATPVQMPSPGWVAVTVAVAVVCVLAAAVVVSARAQRGGGQRG